MDPSPRDPRWLPLENWWEGDSERILRVGVLAPLGLPTTVKWRLIVCGVGGMLGRTDDGRAGVSNS